MVDLLGLAGCVRSLHLKIPRNLIRAGFFLRWIFDAFADIQSRELNHIIFEMRVEVTSKFFENFREE
jgi:hypothetical protein